MSHGAAFCGKSGEIKLKWKLLAGMSRDVGGTPTRAKAKKGENFGGSRLRGWKVGGSPR